jgi:hypothetical protein
MSSTKQVTVRVPVEWASQIESRGGTTAFILKAVGEKLARDRQAEISAGLTCLADDPDEDDFSAPAAAQAQVIARVD